MVKVLYIHGGIMQRGGTEAYMMNYYRHIDHNKVRIDFVVHGYEKGSYDDEILNSGGRIYHVPIKSEHFFEHRRALMRIFQLHEYDIIHSQVDAMNSYILKLAWKCGIPVRISHSHNTQHQTVTHINFLINEYAKKKSMTYATDYFACSLAAGKWLFGDNIQANSKFKIIHNAIDLKKYTFNANLRECLRKQYSLSDTFTIGHVGRFEEQKNHMFLIDIFREIANTFPQCRLVLIGTGSLVPAIEQKIEEYKLQDKVLLIGESSNVNELLNMFDLFVMPSLFEGLPVTGIEAQANSLMCLFSDQITREAAITDNAKFLNILSTEVWCKEIESIYKNPYPRTGDVTDCFIQNGYDIRTESKKLENLYLNMLNTEE